MHNAREYPDPMCPHRRLSESKFNFTFVINGLNHTGKQTVIRYILRRGTGQVFISPGNRLNYNI